MKKITKSILKEQVSHGNGKLRSILVMLSFIFENSEDNENANLSLLTLNRYSSWVVNDMAGDKNPHELNKIIVNTLQLIDKLPQNEYDNPIPLLTKSNIIPVRKSKQILIGSVSTILFFYLLWFAFFRDPFNLVGEWNYIVTPKKVNDYLLGSKNEGGNFEEKFLNYTGTIEIHSISLLGTSYSISGKRTGMKTKKSNDYLENKEKVKLTFSECSHSKSGNSKEFFFMFKADDPDKNRGFVKINNIEYKGDRMTGDIHYLYGDNTWKEVDITFERK